MIEALPDVIAMLNATARWMMIHPGWTVFIVCLVVPGAFINIRK